MRRRSTRSEPCCGPSARRARRSLYLQRSVRLAPHTCAPLSELGSAYLDAGRVTAAIDVIQQCLDNAPNDYASLVNIADAYIASTQPERARATLDHAPNRASRRRGGARRYRVFGGRGRPLAERRRLSISRPIAVDPLQRDAYVDLGYDYNQHGLYALAEASFIKGLSLSPDDGRLHYLLAETYAGSRKARARAERIPARRVERRTGCRARRRDATCPRLQ